MAGRPSKIFWAPWLPVAFYFIAGIIFLLIAGNPKEAWGNLRQSLLVCFVTWLLLTAAKKSVPYRTYCIISIFAVYALLTLLYRQIDSLDNAFGPPIDHALALLDGRLWGFQPSLEFSRRFSQPWFSELVFMGYFSYYLMAPLLLFYTRKKEVKLLGQLGFVLIGSFIIYYLLAIVLPASGPQFYFKAPLNHVEAYGLFGNLVKQIQAAGEIPAAAFPSSHVGISLILLAWSWRNARRLLPILSLFTFLLTLATVYIKAHYAADLIAAFISAPLIYLFLTNLYPCLPKSVAA